ncbi:MAG: 4-hydroxy-tetrahydrodipicolinate reductase [Chloroflexi bacterium]|nr:4-hydroxy-tetrahydrodipicolinate reductase [Chloroflexota bacterium]
MKPIKVVVHGAAGRMGQEIIRALSREPELQVVGGVDVNIPMNQLTLPDGSAVPFSSDLDSMLASTRPDVLVDFTIARATLPAARIAAKRGVNLVVGTTGQSAETIDEIGRLAKENNVGAVVAPNFAIGAVLMMHLAKIAAKYLDTAEIIELHHNQKADAPSGTALATARDMAKARGKPFLHPAESKPMASRGEQVEGISLHSVRLPGLLAHQEVLFGAAGQTLSIRHDTISRECFMPGVILAVKEVVKLKGLTYGLDALLHL